MLAIGAAASGRTLRLREFTFARCAVGRLCEGLREFFLASLWGGCKRSETAIARIYVRSLRVRLPEFFLPHRGRLQAVGAEMARIYVRSLRERLREFFLALLCYRGGCKRSETEIARIYVRSLCQCAVAPTLV